MITRVKIDGSERIAIVLEDKGDIELSKEITKEILSKHSDMMFVNFYSDIMNALVDGIYELGTMPDGYSYKQCEILKKEKEEAV